MGPLSYVLFIVDRNGIMWRMTVFRGGSGAQLPPVVQDVVLRPQRMLDGAQVGCCPRNPGDVYNGG